MIRTADCTACATTHSAPSLSVAALLRRLAIWVKVANERRALGRMSQARLADMGLDCDQAWSEASRPFWDAPQRTR